MVCIKTAGVTVVLSGIPGATAAGVFAAGLNLALTKDALELCVLLQGIHKAFVGKLKFSGGIGNGGRKVRVFIAVGCGGGGKEV